MALIPQSASSDAEWRRKVANAVNNRINGYPFPSFEAEPPAPSPGYTYYDTTLEKVRTFAAGIWNDHF
jgi:hypothetical protein